MLTNQILQHCSETAQKCSLTKVIYLHRTFSIQYVKNTIFWKIILFYFFCFEMSQNGQKSFSYSIKIGVFSFFIHLPKWYLKDKKHTLIFFLYHDTCINSREQTVFLIVSSSQLLCSELNLYFTCFLSGNSGYSHECLSFLISLQKVCSATECNMAGLTWPMQIFLDQFFSVYCDYQCR